LLVVSPDHPDQRLPDNLLAYEHAHTTGQHLLPGSPRRHPNAEVVIARLLPPRPRRILDRRPVHTARAPTQLLHRRRHLLHEGNRRAHRRPHTQPHITRPLAHRPLDHRAKVRLQPRRLSHDVHPPHQRRTHPPHPPPLPTPPPPPTITRKPPHTRLHRRHQLRLLLTLVSPIRQQHRMTNRVRRGGREELGREGEPGAD